MSSYQLGFFWLATPSLVKDIKKECAYYSAKDPRNSIVDDNKKSEDIVKLLTVYEVHEFARE